MVKVFFSYSHYDKTIRDELEKHLAVLKREKEIETWHDRRITAGEDFEKAIDQNLVESQIILLLVSPNFLASEYCYSNELKKALEMREEGIAKVIPIIIDHCDWRNTPLRTLLACPQDGKPIVDFENPNKAYSQVTKEIRKIIKGILVSQPKPEIGRVEIGDSAPFSESNATITNILRSSNLRLKKDFTDYEKDTFKDEAFEYMSKFFKNSLEELEKRNLGITYIYKPETNKFYVTIYRNGSEIAGCLIRNRTDNHFGSGITYSTNKSNNSINCSLVIEDDGYSLFLKPQIGTLGDEYTYSKKGASEFYWNMLIERLQ